MRRYTIYRRRNSPYFYAQIKNPHTNKYLPPKSTRCAEESEALLVVADWLINGIPDKGASRPIVETYSIETLFYQLTTLNLTQKDVEKILGILRDRGFIGNAVLNGVASESHNLIEYMRYIWSFEDSPYVKRKLTRKERISKRHCTDMLSRVKYWLEYFGEEKTVEETTSNDIEDFQTHLSEKLAENTVNKIISAGRVVFGYAKSRNIIQVNPFEGYEALPQNAAERGILTIEEARALFSEKVIWRDERVRIGNQLAMLTGMRAGEIVALHAEDIKPDRIAINHAWNFADGLKLPKTGKTREVPIPEYMSSELLDLAKKSPFAPGGYIFFSTMPDKPMEPSALLVGLREAFIDSKLSEKDRNDEKKRKKVADEMKRRNIVFHSWRHFFAAMMKEKVAKESLKLVTGHSTDEMLEHYADHLQESDFTAVSMAQSEAFSNIVNFKKEAM